jgi:hypothetical protein
MKKKRKMVVDYSVPYLEAVKNLKLAHEALVANRFQEAYDHCLNAQVEIRLMSTAVKTWIPVKEDEHV